MPPPPLIYFRLMKITGDYWARAGLPIFFCQNDREGRGSGGGGGSEQNVLEEYRFGTYWKSRTAEGSSGWKARRQAVTPPPTCPLRRPVTKPGEGARGARGHVIVEAPDRKHANRQLEGGKGKRGWTVRGECCCSPPPYSHPFREGDGLNFCGNAPGGEAFFVFRAPGWKVAGKGRLAGGRSYPEGGPSPFRPPYFSRAQSFFP